MVSRLFKYYCSFSFYQRKPSSNNVYQDLSTNKVYRFYDNQIIAKEIQTNFNGITPFIAPPFSGDNFLDCPIEKTSPYRAISSMNGIELLTQFHFLFNTETIM